MFLKKNSSFVDYKQWIKRYVQLFHSAQTPKLKSKSGPARIVGLTDNDDCEDFCDSTVQCIRFWRLLGSCRINVKHRVSGQDSLFSRAVMLLFSTSQHPPPPPTALLLRLSFPFFPSAVSSPRGPYSQIGLHWGDKCWANALKHIQ